jgi:hypothetical protein
VDSPCHFCLDPLLAKLDTIRRAGLGEVLSCDGIRDDKALAFVATKSLLDFADTAEAQDFRRWLQTTLDEPRGNEICGKLEDLIVQLERIWLMSQTLDVTERARTPEMSPADLRQFERARSVWERIRSLAEDLHADLVGIAEELDAGPD